jgi:hypothetical protein
MLRNLATLLISFGVASISHAESNVLHADIAFHFSCKGQAAIEIGNQIEAFLQREGFEVLNRARLEQEHGVYLNGLEVIGLDKPNRMIDFRASHVGDAYSVALNTRPPTKHSSQFEESLLKFVSQKLGCAVRQVTRGENGADAIGFYDRLVELRDALFREAERLRGERRL